MPLVNTTSDGRYVGRWFEFEFNNVLYSARYRNFTERKQASEIDATAGGDTIMQVVQGALDQTLTLTVLDSQPGHDVWAAFDVGSVGPAEWRPAGIGVGKKQHAATIQVNSMTRGIPYNDIPTIDIEARITTAITTTTLA